MAGVDARPSCGRPLDVHSPDYRFTLPEPVLALPNRERTDGIWMSHGDAQSSVMMQVPDCGAFVRALLPVRLTGGHSAMFGLWIEVPPDVLHDALRVCRAVVRDVDHTPYCESSSDQQFTKVLTEEWPHAQVLEAIGIA